MRINYRTTEQIRAWATAVLRSVETDDLDGGREDEKGYTVAAIRPETRDEALPNPARRAGIPQREGSRTCSRSARPEDICLVARTTRQVKEDYEAMLKRLGVTATVLDKNREGAGGGVRLATMHRVKGLEYPVMILAGVNARTVPLHVASVESDPTNKAEHEDRERSILFVAATRARDQLIVTSWGAPSPFLTAVASGEG